MPLPPPCPHLFITRKRVQANTHAQQQNQQHQHQHQHQQQQQQQQQQEHARPRLAVPCAQVILPQGSEVRLLNFLLPLISVTLSMALGAFGGLLLGTLLLRARSLPASSVLQTTTQHVAEVQQASRCVLRVVISVAGGGRRPCGPASRTSHVCPVCPCRA